MKKSADMPVAKGRREYLKKRRGERLTYKEAIYAMCYECVNCYRDGKVDCGTRDCALYQFMPYAGNKSRRSK